MNKTLNQWCSDQRKMYHKNRDKDKERINLLKEIGFVFESTCEEEKQKLWMKRYNEVKHFGKMDIHM